MNAVLASIVHDAQLRYPDPDEFFSPSTAYPEYPFAHVARKPNPVYDAVRRCFAQAGLDAARFGTRAWNPLGSWVTPGDKVFLLCNFVYHRRPQETAEEFHGKCTHGSVVRALADYVHIALGRRGSVSFGNAPLQSCDWERVLSDAHADVVLQFYRREGVDVSAKDLRLFVAHRNALGQITSTTERDDAGAVVVALDRKSLLDELYEGTRHEPSFRVSEYNPDRTERRHGLHRHEYVINREILASSVILSVPKLKTHEKVGITVGLKGFVGSVGHKDCLAHHRFGSGRENGDEYPDGGPAQVLLSSFHDVVYRRRYPSWLNSPLEIADSTLRRISKKVLKRIRSGAWYGNDTAWRMTLDLARILRYADERDVLSQRPARRHLVLVDGIVGGEGDGPLSPVAARSNTVVFSDDVVQGDAVACRLMGFDPAKIPLVDRARRDPLLVGDADAGRSLECIYNGERMRLDVLPPVLGRAFVPPKGWRGHV